MSGRLWCFGSVVAGPDAMIAALLGPAAVVVSGGLRHLGTVEVGLDATAMAPLGLRERT